MARNAVKRGDAVTDEKRSEAHEEAVKPLVQGGALGVVPDRRELAIAGALPSLSGAARQREQPVVPPARRWRVRVAASVMYDHCRVTLRAGKIVTDQTYNIGMLERQGVILDELPPEKPAVAAPVLPEPEAEEPKPETAAE